MSKTIIITKTIIISIVIILLVYFSPYMYVRFHPLQQLPLSTTCLLLLSEKGKMRFEENKRKYIGQDIPRHIWITTPKETNIPQRILDSYKEYAPD